MATTKIYIKNPQVNSNEKINLLGDSVRSTWSIFTATRDIPTKDITDSYDTRLGKGINTGFANPEHTVSGKYDLDSDHTTDSGALIDYEHIKDLAIRSDQVMTLYAAKFITTDNAAGSISVMLVEIQDDNENTNVCNYKLVFKEVNSES